MASSSPVFPPPPQIHNGFSFHSASGSPTTAIKRRRSSTDDLDDESVHDNTLTIKAEGKQKQARGAPKRACNECRQQKLRCDVQEQPSFKSCTRCEKQHLLCSIDENFKRVAKRSRVADLERHNQELVDENEQLRKQLEELSRRDPFVQPPVIRVPSSTAGTAQPLVDFSVDTEKFLGKNLAAASLLDLRSGSPSIHSNLVIGKVQVTPEQAQELFNEFFQNYHRYLPFLDPQQTPQQYMARSQALPGLRLLCWAIIAVGARHYEADKTIVDRLKQPLLDLIWDAIQRLPQDYNIVKALAVLCTWPLPTSRTTTDPTYMFCGNMMSIATQLGLHKPQHAQDFSREKLQLRREDIEDRLKTWVVCNIVAQRVSTGHGYYPTTLWDTLDLTSEETEVAKVLGPELYAMAKLEIESDSISKLLHIRVEPQEMSSVNHRALQAATASKRVEQLQHLYSHVLNSECVSAVLLHLRLHALFASGTVFDTAISDLWTASNKYLGEVIQIGDDIRYIRDPRYFPNYLAEMMIAAAFTLLRILNSPLGSLEVLDVQAGQAYFRAGVEAIKVTSVIDNDLPTRYSDVLAQLYNMYGKQAFGENSLHLKVRTRLSQSVVFDSVWRWREIQAGHSDLDTTDNNPNNATPEPTSTVVAQIQGYVPHSHSDPTLAPLPLPVSMSYGQNFLAAANEQDLFDVGWNFDMSNDYSYQNFVINGFGTPIQ